MKLVKLLPALCLVILFSTNAVEAKIDWRKVSKLQGQSLLDYAASLDLKDQDALNFWKNIPVSKANKQVIFFNPRFQERAVLFNLCNRQACA